MEKSEEHRGKSIVVELNESEEKGGAHDGKHKKDEERHNVEAYADK